jgi:hypothetical protein
MGFISKKMGLVLLNFINKESFFFGKITTNK